MTKSQKLMLLVSIIINFYVCLIFKMPSVCNLDETYTIETFFMPTNSSGIVRLVACFASILGSLLTLFWVKREEFLSQTDDSASVKNAIFPVFVNILWMSASINILYSIVIVFLNFPGADNNELLDSVMYAFIAALQHGVSEGIALLLMTKGCGYRSATKVMYLILVWVSLNWFIFTIFFWKGTIITAVMALIWDFGLMLFYLALCFAPQNRLFRRPAAIPYAFCLSLFRCMVTVMDIFLLCPAVDDYASCGYIFIWLVMFPITQPFLCFWTLRQDSRWWQGYDVSSFGQGMRESFVVLHAKHSKRYKIITFLINQNLR